MDGLRFGSVGRLGKLQGGIGSLLSSTIPFHGGTSCRQSGDSSRGLLFQAQEVATFRETGSFVLVGTFCRNSRDAASAGLPTLAFRPPLSSIAVKLALEELVDMGILDRSLMRLWYV
jgi:hypothetical protein